MPFIHRRGYLKLARESAPGVLSTTSLAGINNGPLSVLGGPTFNGATAANVMGIPTLTREFEPTYHKHTTPMQVGRRYEDVAMVPGRRETQGTFTGPATPDALGMLLNLTFGTDTVTAIQTNTIALAGTTANSTTLSLTTATSAAVTVGQRVWISDGANSEYVNVGVAAASGVTSVTITAGAGTGGGFKFAHASGVAVEFGPWSHAFTPSNSATGLPTFEAEDNFGGHTNSAYYTSASIDSFELNAAIDNDAEAMTWSAKFVGVAPSNIGTTAGTGFFTLPTEEVPMVPGNAAVWTDPPNATLPSAPFNHIYVPDFKATVTNNAKLVKAAVGSPDPYTSVVTNWHLRGSMETIFEDYSIFQQYQNNTIWAPVNIKFNWGATVLQSTLGAVSPSLTININRFGIEKANKQQMKEDIVRLPIENWRALDYPDFTAMTTWTVLSGVARY